MTAQSPPVTTVDNIGNIQPESNNGLNSSDSNGLSDTTSHNDGSENADVPTASKKSKSRASAVKYDIPYQEIVYDDQVACIPEVLKKRMNR